MTCKHTCAHTMPSHGGRLRAAARQYGGALADWLDLSTGINPRGWPVPTLPPTCWQRLPEDEDDLCSAATRYYGAADPLPLAGSQAAIQLLPRLRTTCRVGVLALSYAEHAHAWHAAGHQLVALDEKALDANWSPASAQLDALIIVHPNNPTGRRWPPETLLNWHTDLAARGGWLVVDEAFMDATPQTSLLPYAGRPGLIVLRSLGKFFGLAGARVGFLWTEPTIREQLHHQLGPWTLSGPARWVATQALANADWQAATRAWLPEQSQRLASLLERHGLTPAGATGLFQWCRTEQAATLAERLAQQAILVRRFEHPASLRFGLPGTQPAWQRLDDALGALMFR